MYVLGTYKHIAILTLAKLMATSTTKVPPMSLLPTVNCRTLGSWFSRSRFGGGLQPGRPDEFMKKSPEMWPDLPILLSKLIQNMNCGFK
jgi:hypothetical protein